MWFPLYSLHRLYLYVCHFELCSCEWLWFFHLSSPLFFLTCLGCVRDKFAHGVREDSFRVSGSKTKPTNWEREGAEGQGGWEDSRAYKQNCFRPHGLYPRESIFKPRSPCWAMRPKRRGMWKPETEGGLWDVMCRGDSHWRQRERRSLCMFSRGRKEGGGGRQHTKKSILCTGAILVAPLHSGLQIWLLRWVLDTYTHMQIAQNQ